MFYDDDAYGRGENDYFSPEGWVVYVLETEGGYVDEDTYTFYPTYEHDSDGFMEYVLESIPDFLTETGEIREDKFQSEFEGDKAKDRYWDLIQDKLYRLSDEDLSEDRMDAVWSVLQAVTIDAQRAREIILEHAQKLNR